jgi:hypothetical protein
MKERRLPAGPPPARRQIAMPSSRNPAAHEARAVVGSAMPFDADRISSPRNAQKSRERHPAVLIDKKRQYQY